MAYIRVRPHKGINDCTRIVSYKLVLVGDAGVGKSTYIKRLLTGEFETKYVPTCGVTVNRLTFSTTKGPVSFKVYDLAGQERIGTDQSTHYTDADCAIVMYDCHSKLSLQNVQVWINDIHRNCGDIPIVVCGNKCDVKGRQYFSRRDETQWLISAKSNMNYEKPFLHLIRVLKEDQELEFTPSPAMEPPEVTLSPEILTQYSRELTTAHL